MRAIALVLVGLSLAAAGSAELAARSDRDALIRPGRGIGRIDLGMTETQVRRALGRPSYVTTERGSFGLRTRTLVYGSGSVDSVVVRGSGAIVRAIAVTTTSPRERSSVGVGPGSTIVRLRGRVRGLRCTDVFPVVGGTLVQREYLLVSAGGRETVFVPGKWRFYNRDTTKTIAYVTVCERGADGPFSARRC